MALLSPVTWLATCSVVFVVGWLVLWGERLEARHARYLVEREVYRQEHGE